MNKVIGLDKKMYSTADPSFPGPGQYNDQSSYKESIIAPKYSMRIKTRKECKCLLTLPNFNNFIVFDINGNPGPG